MRTVRPNAILYDDDEIRVIWHRGREENAAFALVTFGDLMGFADDTRFFADGPASKAGISCIGVMAKSGNWFPRRSIAAAAAKIRRRIDGFPHRILYGGSMGGYAAIKHSRLLQATEIVALCPQWSIDPAECEGRNPGWQEHLVPSMAGMGIRAEDVAGEVFVFADPFDALDRFHVEMIRRACPAMHAINVPMVGHNVTSVFAGTQNLRQLLDASRAHSVADLVRLGRQFRKDHPLRRQTLVARAAARHPQMIFPVVLKAVRDRQGWVGEDARHVNQTAAWLVRRGERAEACALLADAAALLADPARQLLAWAFRARLAGSRVVVATHRGTHLLYDAGLDRCVHAASPDDPAHAYVRIELHGAGGVLFFEMGGSRFDLAVDRSGLLCVCPDTPDHRQPARFDIGAAGPGRFTLSAAGVYLSAEPGGRVVCNRSEPQDWELFCAGNAADHDAAWAPPA